MTTVIASAFRQAGSAKVVGRWVGAHYRSVERWQRGEAEPGAGALLRLMARSRDAARIIAEATGLTDEWMDAEQARLIEALAELRARRRHEKTAAQGDVAARPTASEAAASAALTLAERLR